MQRQENNIYYAGFFVRLGAWIIDWILVAVLLSIIKIPLLISTFGETKGYLFTEILFQFTIWDILFYILAKSYYVAMTYSTGSTIGKKLMNIKVVSDKEGEVTFWNILYRETIGKYLSGLFLCIGYIIIGIDHEKRGFHDMLSDTRVVYKTGSQSNVETSELEENRDKRNENPANLNEEDTPYQAASYGYQPKQRDLEETEEQLKDKRENEENDESSYN